jgi:hypothetical protein
MFYMPWNSFPARVQKDSSDGVFSISKYSCIPAKSNQVNASQESGKVEAESALT